MSRIEELKKQNPQFSLNYVDIINELFDKPIYTEMVINLLKNQFNVDKSLRGTAIRRELVNEFKIDVKTKRTIVMPKENYLCSISSFNIKQKCDFYFFVQVNANLKEGYLLGYKSKKLFFEQATYNEEGSLDYDGYVFKDSYNLMVKDLNKFKE